MTFMPMYMVTTMHTHTPKHPMHTQCTLTVVHDPTDTPAADRDASDHL